MNTSRSAPPAEARTTSSGPADVPVSLVVAARKGDPAAFARMVEHWNEHLRPFVHHTLGGLGDTDRVLAAAYVRAYRALPRYQAHRTPGLWLHRIAFLAATDELRRVRRDPTRRGGRSEAITGTGEAPPGWYRLGPDQRALAVMLDVERFPASMVASAFDTELSVVQDRVDRARRVFVDPPARPAPTHHTPSASDPAPANATGEHHYGGFPPLGPTAYRPEDPTAATEIDAQVAMWAAALVEAGAGTGTGSIRVEPPAIDLTEARPADRQPLEIGLTDVGEAARIGSAPTDGPGHDPLVGNDEGHESEELTEAQLVDRCREAVCGLSVPPTPDDFWPDLGRRLLAERASPAAPTLDPMARLAKAHPSEPGFDPDQAHPKRPSAAVTTLADQADWVRPRRRWGPIALALLAVVAVGAVLWIAIRLGTSDPVPDGSVLTSALANDMSAALAEGPYQSVEISVEAPVGVTGSDPVPYRMMIAANGSWLVNATDRIDQTTYDADEGVLRRVAVVGTADTPEDELQILATEERGLATGSPDITATRPGPLVDLQLAISLLRANGDDRARPTTVRETSTWTYATTAPTGENGAEEQWRMVIRRADKLPMVIERMSGETLVRRTDFSAFQLESNVTSTTFLQPLPEGVEASTTDHGYVTTDLAAVGLLGRGEAVTPAWLPDGFELASVAVRQEAPLSARPTGNGENPADRSVASMSFQRGIQRITVSTRDAGDEPGAWRDPFRATEATSAPVTETLGDGRFNGAEVSMRTTAVGSALLWGIHEGVVFTVSGDLTPSDALRVAATLR